MKAFQGSFLKGFVCLKASLAVQAGGVPLRGGPLEVLGV